MDTNSITLWNNKGRSDKLYIVNLEKVPLKNKYTVKFAYGRRNSSLVEGIKEENIPLFKAQQVFNKLIESKQKKDYDILNTMRDFDRGYKNYLTLILNELFSNDIIPKEHYNRIHGLIESPNKEDNRLAEEIILSKDNSVTNK
jgi:hypothetical protein